MTPPLPENLRPDIRRLNTLIAQAWEATVAAGAVGPGADAATCLAAFVVACETGNPQAARQQLKRLDILLAAAAQADAAQQRYLQLLERKRQLVDTQVKTQRATSRLYTEEELDGILAALGASVRNEVTDRTVLRRILDTFNAKTAELMIAWDVPGADQAAIEAAEHDTASA